MRRLNKLVTILCSAMMLTAAFIQPAAAEESLQVDMNYTTQTVVVSGGAQAGTMVMGALLGPSAEEQPPYTLSDAKEKPNVIVGFTQAIADETGGFSLSFKLPGSYRSGVYAVKIGYGQAPEDETARTQTIRIVSQSYLEEVIRMAGVLKEDEVEAFLESYQSLFGIQPDEAYRAAKQQIRQQFIRERNHMGGFETSNDVTAAWNQAVALVSVKNAKDGAAEGLLKTYMEILELAESDIPNSLEPQLSRALRSNASILEYAEDVKTRLPELEALASINRASRSGLTEVLRRYEEVIGISLSDDYLKHTEKVNMNLTNQDFATLDGFVRAYHEEIASLSGGGSSGGGSSGSGGGGGRLLAGASAAVTATLPQEPSAEKTELSFNDLNEVEWAVPAIYVLAKKGIVNGVSEGEFAPNQNITREEFTTMLVRAVDLYSASASADFVDVSPSEWYYSYVGSAKQAGLVEGVGDGRFGTGRSITRLDIALMLERVITVKQMQIELLSERAELTFDDTDNPAVTKLFQMGILNGKEDGVYEPESFATRAEAAKMIYEILTRMEEVL